MVSLRYARAVVRSGRDLLVGVQVRPSGMRRMMKGVDDILDANQNTALVR
jgi:hypothetical protein